MKNVELYEYLSSVIDDKYILELLYQSFRKASIENGFSLESVNKIVLSEKYVNETVTIDISQLCYTNLESLALLLSIRAIMLEPSLLEDCDSSSLIFKANSENAFEWLYYIPIITKNRKDEDFNNIFQLLESMTFHDTIPDQLKEEFVTKTVLPKPKNLSVYYSSRAEGKVKDATDVICNNAYLDNSDIVDFIIPENIEYIGNTAFAYCENLETLTFLNSDTLFGKFPIVECPKLTKIIVPTGSEEYFKTELPHYKDIIITHAQQEILLINERRISIVSEPENISEINIVKNQEKEEPCRKEDSTKVESTNTQSKPQEKRRLTRKEFETIFSVFDNATTSYKYLWFLSILTLLKERSQVSIDFKTLVVRMVSIAWPIILVDDLSFGANDQLKKIIAEIIKTSSLATSSRTCEVETFLTKEYSDYHSLLSPLLKYVPFRFLSPWIKYSTDEEVRKATQNNTQSVPYQLFLEHIEISNAWALYILLHYSECFDFLFSSFKNYLENKNNRLDSKQLRKRIKMIYA